MSVVLKALIFLYAVCINLPLPSRLPLRRKKKFTNSSKMSLFQKTSLTSHTRRQDHICSGHCSAKEILLSWWPTCILITTVSWKDDGLLVLADAHISWFGSPTTSSLAFLQLSPFLEKFQSCFNKKGKGLYHKVIAN